MGRLEHLQQTLPQNLLGNLNTDDVEVEFVVLNYGDKDGMHEWMTTDSQIQEEIEAGRIVYARTEQPVFRMAHAKNMAHRLASGDVVCNVDADNFTGKGFAAALADFFEREPNTIINPAYSTLRKHTDTDRHGVFGRIAMTRQNYELLGGYDESYEGWGGEDTNLTRRARMHGILYKRFEAEDYLHVIPHGDDVRVKNMFTDDRARKKGEEKVRFYKGATGLQKIWKASKDRLPLFVRSRTANSGTHFGLGRINFLDNREVNLEIKPLTGVRSRLFNSLARVKHLPNLFRDRLSPEVISLKGPGV